MTLIYQNRVKDISTTNGSNNIVLNNTPPLNYRSFGKVMSNGDKTIYFIEHQTLNQWELGIGTYSNNEISRDLVIDNSLETTTLVGTWDGTGPIVYDITTSTKQINVGWAVSGTNILAGTIVTEIINDSVIRISTTPLGAQLNQPITFTRNDNPLLPIILDTGTKNISMINPADFANHSGTYANLGKSVVPNTVYYPSDSAYEKLICNGTNPSGSNIMGWDHYLPIAGKVTQVPFDGIGSNPTLFSTINNSVTNLTCSDLSFINGQTWTVPFMIRIDNEVMLVTTVVGLNYTVIRGYNGTIATSHSASSTINHIAWHWINQGAASADNTAGGINITNNTPNASVHIINALVRPLPTGNYTVIGAFVPRWNEINYGIPVIGLRDSSTGKMKVNGIFRYDSANNAYWWRLNMNSATSVSPTSAAITAVAPLLNGPVFWFKFTDDGTNSKMFLSADSRNWGLVYSENRTTHCTADQFAIGTSAYNHPTSIHLLSYKEHNSVV